MADILDGEVATTRALINAVTIAALAPSIHNTQPWRWRIHDATADLFADTQRQLRVVDPDRRLLTISCGAVLHHVCVALAADGFAVGVDLLPTAADEDHLARITVTGHAPATDAATAHREAIRVRRTDRRPLLDVPIGDGVFGELRTAAAEFGIGLQRLGADDVDTLAAATHQAQRDLRQDRAIRTELDAWASDRRPPFAGVPDENIPNRTPPTTVPVRDFGHIGTLATAGGRDAAATYVIVHGPDDTPSSWLRAGQALSAMWLAATERGIALLPLSAPIEQFATRQMLTHMLGGIGFPELAIRLGLANPNQPVAPPTPRLPAAAILEVD
jgi:nitroreductase